MTRRRNRLIELYSKVLLANTNDATLVRAAIMKIVNLANEVVLAENEPLTKPEDTAEDEIANRFKELLNIATNDSANSPSLAQRLKQMQNEQLRKARNL